MTGMSLHLIGMVATAAATVGVHASDEAGKLTTRVVHSEAVCIGTDYNWMSNQKSQSPCDVVAYAYSACLSPDFTLPALQSNTPDGRSFNYDLPDEKSADACRCSWATYNLLGACTVCQGHEDSTFFNWAGYSANCTKYEDDTTYWPPTVTLSSAVSIPYWAGKNPRTWQDGHFNKIEAQNLDNEGHPDLASDTTPPKKKSPTGPIVGGVIGGLLVVLAAVSIFVFLKIRKRRSAANFKKSNNNRPYTNGEYKMEHGRNYSDSTNATRFPPQAPLGVAEFGAIAQRPFSQNSSSNIHAVSYFGGEPQQPQPGLLPHPLLPLPQQHQQQQTQLHQRPHHTREMSDTTAGMIEPFTLQASDTTRYPADTKGGSGAGGMYFPEYDQPNAPPVAYNEVNGGGSGTGPNASSSSIVTTPPRARMTPPAYTRTDTGTSAQMTTPPYPGTPGSGGGGGYTNRRRNNNNNNNNWDEKNASGSNMDTSLDTTGDTSWGSPGQFVLNPEALVRRQQGQMNVVGEISGSPPPMMRETEKKRRKSEDAEM